MLILNGKLRHYANLACFGTTNMSARPSLTVGLPTLQNGVPCRTVISNPARIRSAASRAACLIEYSE